MSHWHHTEHSPEKVIHILKIYQLQWYEKKQNNHCNLPILDHYFVDLSLQVVEWSSLGWKLCWRELPRCRNHLFPHVRKIRILIRQVNSGVIACLLTHLQTSFLFILCLCSRAFFFLISAFFFLDAIPFVPLYKMRSYK